MYSPRLSLANQNVDVFVLLKALGDLWFVKSPEEQSDILDLVVLNILDSIRRSTTYILIFDSHSFDTEQKPKLARKSGPDRPGKLTWNDRFGWLLLNCFLLSTPSSICLNQPPSWQSTRNTREGLFPHRSSQWSTSSRIDLKDDVPANPKLLDHPRAYRISRYSVQLSPYVSLGRAIIVSGQSVQNLCSRDCSWNQGVSTVMHQWATWFCRQGSWNREEYWRRL